MSLMGTMSGQGVVGQIESEQQRRAAELDAQTRAAVEASRQAADQYQQAAATPPTQLSGMEQLAPLLLASIASVLQGNSAPTERAHASIQSKQSELLRARSDNLQALHDIFAQRAKQAEETGSAAEAEKFRSKMETLSRQHEQVLARMRESGMNQREGAGNRQAERNSLIGQGINPDTMEPLPAGGGTALTRMGMGFDVGQNDPGDPVKAAADAVETGQIQFTAVPFNIRLRVLSTLSDRGSKILPPKVRDTISTVSAARGVLEELNKLAETVNVHGAGASRIVGGLGSAARGALQINVDDAIYDKARNGFLATISRATGERGVLTDRDVLRAKALLPSRYDSKAVARRQIGQLRSFLDNIEKRAVTVYTTTGAGQAASTPAQTEGPADFNWVPGQGLVPVGGR